VRRTFSWLAISTALIAGCSKHNGAPATGPYPGAASTEVEPAAPASAQDLQRISDSILHGKPDELFAILEKTPSLLERKDYMERTPLHLAAAFGTADEVKWLLEKGANVNTRSYNMLTPLHVTRDGKTAAMLIRAGADLNAVDAVGNTPLQMAAEFGEPEVVDAILASGFKMDLRSAIRLEKRDIVKEMLRKDSGIAKRPTMVWGLSGGETPLALAAGQKDLELVELLLDAGADVNEETRVLNAERGATALTNAVWAGDTRIVNMLLSHGAKTNAGGGWRYRTILDYARANSSKEILSMLEEAEKKR
jgi:ankyrin repeat protein